jgi:hypothetical protein
MFGGQGQRQGGHGQGFEQGFGQGFQQGFGGHGGGGGQQARGGGSLFNLKKDGIYPLTAKDFPSKTSKFVWLVLFYNSQSTNEEVVQDYIKLGAKLKRYGVKTGAVNCDKYPEKCEEVVTAGDSRRNAVFKAALITKGAAQILNDSDLMKNKNTLNAKKMFEFVRDSTPTFVLNIRKAHQLENLISSGGSSATAPVTTPRGCGSTGACLILWTANFDSSLLMKTLSVAHESAVTIAEVRGGNEKLGRAFNVEQFPTLMMVCESSGQWQSFDHVAYEVFEGDYKDATAINTFVKSYADKTKCKSLRNKLRKKNKDTKKSAEDYMSDMMNAGEQGLKDFGRKKVSELKQLATAIGINVDEMESLVEKQDLVHSIFEFWTNK